MCLEMMGLNLDWIEFNHNLINLYQEIPRTQIEMAFDQQKSICFCEMIISETIHINQAHKKYSNIYLCSNLQKEMLI